MQIFLGTAPLTLADWGLLAILGLSVLIAGEVYKVIRLRAGRASRAAG
jgi:Ca2+-transporting ATPase